MFPPEARQQFEITKALTGLEPQETWRRKLQHSSLLCRTAPVWRGDHGPKQLPRAEQLLDLTKIFVDAEQACSVEESLGKAHTEGIVVLHKGVVIAEKYYHDTQPQTKQPVWSVSKSLIGVVVANLVEEGVMSYEAQLTDLLPELKGTVWEDVSVRHAVMQASGVKITMGWAPGCDMYQDMQAVGFEPMPHGQEPPLLFDSVKEATERLFEPGSYFDYNEGNAHVVAWACQRATATSWQDLVSQHVWRKIGAAEDGQFLVDAAGIAEAAGGYCCTVVDLARYGLAIMHSDDTALAQRLLPAGFFKRIQSDAAASPGTAAAHDPNNILNTQFLDEILGYAHYFVYARYGDHKVVMAAGFMGQVSMMQPELDLVIARTGSAALGDFQLSCRNTFVAILDHVAAMQQK